MSPQPTADPSARPSCVMLLSLWAPPAAPWHARLVSADAHVHEFDSPFELARFVAQGTPCPATPDALSNPGLR